MSKEHHYQLGGFPWVLFSGLFLTLIALALCGCAGLPTIPSCGPGQKPVLDPMTGQFVCVVVTEPTAPPTAVPTATPTAMPTTTPTAPPTLPPQNSAQPFPQGLGESQYVNLSGHTGSATNQIVEARIKAYLAKRGVNCEGEDCDALPEGCRIYQLELSAEIRAGGLSAGPWSATKADNIYVAQPGENDPWKAIWDCFHVGGGPTAWDDQTLPDGTVVPPHHCKPRFPHVAPADSYCGTVKLLPAQATRVPCTKEGLGIRIECRKFSDVICDATAYIHNSAYCSAVWSGPDYDPNKQGSCEFGQHESLQREVCERAPGWVWTFNGQPRSIHNDNPFLTSFAPDEKGEVKICSADGQVCATHELK
jgi:hypothetical protein